MAAIFSRPQCVNVISEVQYQEMIAEIAINDFFDEYDLITC